MSPQELKRAAKARQSVVALGFNRDLDGGGLAGSERPLPAAFWLNVNWSVVDRALPTMTIYKRKPKT